jgi:hypothetical protein
VGRNNRVVREGHDHHDHHASQLVKEDSHGRQDHHASRVRPQVRLRYL